MLESLTKETFSQYLGEEFRIHRVDEESVAAELTEVTALGSRPFAGAGARSSERRESPSRSSSEAPVEQGRYYEAVFS